MIPIDENRSENYVEYFCVPRMLALSELGWDAAAQRDYADFSRRMKQQYQRLSAKGCTYRVPEPVVKSEVKQADGSVGVTLESPVEGAVVRYTTDGSYPTVHSKIYQGETITVKNRPFGHYGSDTDALFFAALHGARLQRLQVVWRLHRRLAAPPCAANGPALAL